MQTIKAVVEEITEDSITVFAGEEEREIVVLKADISYPEDMKPGDWVEMEKEGENVISIRVNEKETDQVKKRIQEKMDLLRKRSSDRENEG